MGEILYNHKTMKIRQLLIIFKRYRGFLKSAGWIVSGNKSPRWWGGVKSPEEIAITAILVQLSTWTSVEKILKILRKDELTIFDNLKDADINKLEELIRPVGLWKEKAKRLIELATEVVKIGGLGKLRRTENSRDLLLSIKGIGMETADSITLFALNKSTMPISNYTRIVLGRIGVINPRHSYEDLRRELTMETSDDVFDLKLLYAGVTSIGRIVCKKKPKCNLCPLRYQCSFANSRSKISIKESG